MIVTITFILFMSGLLFFGTVSLISRNVKWKKERICRQLSKEGAANNLIFCSQEILQNKVIGFDGIHRKIMVLEKSKNTYNTSIISLDEVQHCELVTAEQAANAEVSNNSNKKITNHVLELRFDFVNPNKNTSISFNGFTNSKRELDLLKAKAEFWCIMFSKMLNGQVGVRA